jgi:hypothetical protein
MLEEELLRMDSITTRLGGHMPVSAREERRFGRQIHKDRVDLMERVDIILSKYSKCIKDSGTTSSNWVRNGDVDTGRHAKTTVANERRNTGLQNLSEP